MMDEAMEVCLKLIHIVRWTVVLLALSVVAGRPAQAQNNLTAADIQRLQDAIADAARDVSQTPGATASQLTTALDDARDETIYLKVKLRKGETVPRNEYFDLRDRIDDIRAKARSASARAAAPASSAASGTRKTGEVPVGTELDVRLQTSLSSGTAQVEDRFSATTMVDLGQNDRVLIPAGSTLRGVVSAVNKAGRIDRKGGLTLAFDRITVNGREHPVRATVTGALESEGVRGEAGRIGAGAGVGAILGGILGGFKGALAGILIGGGGTIAATEGKDVELPVGTVLRIRLDTAIDLR
jgi:hypothetical protein